MRTQRIAHAMCPYCDFLVAAEYHHFVLDFEMFWTQVAITALMYGLDKAADWYWQETHNNAWEDFFRWD